MSRSRRQPGISMQGHRSSRVEIRLMVLVLMLTLLAMVPALAGPRESGDVEIARAVSRLQPDAPLER